MNMTSSISRRIALAATVSLTAIACSPINAQSPLQDTASVQDTDQEVVKEKKGIRIVKRGKGDNKVEWKSSDGELHEFIVSDEGDEDHVIKFTDEDGNVVIKDVKIRMGDGPHVVFRTKDGDMELKRFGDKERIWHSKDGHMMREKFGDERSDVRVMVIDNVDGEPHRIKVKTTYKDGEMEIQVEGGEIHVDADGNKVVVYTDKDGKKHEMKIREKLRGNFVMAGRGDRDHDRKMMRVMRTRDHKVNVRIPDSQEIGERVRVEFRRANNELDRARAELKEAMSEVEKEMSAIEDKDSAEYQGLEIARQAIESAMKSLKREHFDEKKMRFHVRKMNKELMSHLNEAMEDVHEQREIIVELQEELHEEVAEAREEMHEMLIEIEEMDEGEEREIRMQVIEEMQETMGEMSEMRLEALKRAEKELREARVELERKIAKQKVKDEADKNKDDEKDN